MHRVFFVIPVYNVERYLKRAVDSVLRQTHTDTYTILIDDGSTDSSGAICDEYAQRYENIEVYHKINGGLSDARNTGIARCLQIGEPDDFVCFFDSDDFLHETFAEKMLAICKAHDCQMVQCAYEKGSADTFSSGKKKTRLFLGDKRDALLGYRLKTPVTNKLYELDLLQGETFPVGKLNEDEFFQYRLIYKCRHVAYTTENLYYYYQRSGSIMDEVAKKLKNSPHRYDWMYAYLERIAFFEERNEPDLAMRTCEKICSDIILRHTEQLRLKKEDRDPAVGNGEYIRTYRYFYKIMMKRKGIPFMRAMMYRVFYVCPVLSNVADKFTELRK